MELFNFTITFFGMVTFIVLAGICCWWVNATIVDRTDDEVGNVIASFVVLCIALVFFSWMYDKQPIVYIFSKEFVKDVILYGVIGIVYAAFEYTISIFKTRNEATEAWKKFILTKVKITLKEQSVMVNSMFTGIYVNPEKYEDLQKQVTLTDTDVKTFLLSKTEVNSDNKLYNELVEFLFNLFTEHHIKLRGYKSVIKFVLDRNNGVPEAVINRNSTYGWICAWVSFWPAYFISFMFADFFMKIFKIIDKIASVLGGRLVKIIFKNSFKL